MRLAQIARHAIAPIQLIDLMRCQWRSREAIEGLQRRRLRKLIEHAYARTNFYRQRFDSIGINPREIATSQGFRNIPVLTRDDLRDPLAMIDRNLSSQDLPKSSTSGSTGRRTTVYFDQRGHFLAKMLIKARARLTCGVRPWHRIALFQEEPYWGRSVDRGRVRSFSIHEPFETLLSQVERFSPDVLYGFPGHLALLGEAAVGRLAPNLVFTSGELLDANLRQRLECAFGAPVLDVYGCTETKEIAFQCPEYGRYHLNADWIYLEAVRPDDASGAEPGTLLVTSLYNFGMPLIRYAMGDSGRLLNESCPCGRGLPLIQPTSGRVVDYFELTDGSRIAPYSMTCAIEMVLGMRQYQIAQTSIDRVVVRVVPTEDFDSSAEAAIRSKLGPILPGIVVTVERVDRLAPERSGKYRVVRSELASRSN